MTEQEYVKTLREAAQQYLDMHRLPTWQQQERVGERWVELMDKMSPRTMLSLSPVQ